MQSDIIAAIITGASTIIAGALSILKIDRNRRNTDNSRIFSGGVFVLLLIMLLCMFIIGVIAGKNIFVAVNQNHQGFTMEIDGESIFVTPEMYEDLYNSKKSDEKTTSAKTDISSQTPTATPVGRKSDYLIYFLEPYQTNHYKKVIDNSMKMGGKSYNNGFQLRGSMNENNALFNFEGKYKVFSGIIGCDDESTIDSMTVEFYGDNLLIHTIVLNRGDLPQDFSIDVSSVNKFEIALKDTFSGYMDFADLKVK